MSKVNRMSFLNALQVIAARAKGQEEGEIEEKVFASQSLQPDVLAFDREVRARAHRSHHAQTAFQATEEFAKHLQAAVESYVGRAGTTSPKSTKYSPLVATPVIFKGVWQSRQVADQLGIPYKFYADTALRYWESNDHGRVPLPSQLYARDVVLHVTTEWQMETAYLDHVASKAVADELPGKQ